MTNIETIYGEKETIVAMEDRKINGRKIENQWQKDRKSMVERQKYNGRKIDNRMWQRDLVDNEFSSQVCQLILIVGIQTIE